MKTFLRLVCASSLACATWAVWGADAQWRPAKPINPKNATLEARVAAPTKSSEGDAKSSAKIVAKPTGADSTTNLTAAIVDQPVVVPAVENSLPATARPIAAVPVSSSSQVRVSLSTLTPTPEMWFYEQMRADYNDVALQARRRAEWNAAQRRARIAAREWYGYSNSRPTAHPTPFTYYYSAQWGSNTSNPFIWSARANPVFVPARATFIGLSGFGW
jgi:hypothetical protein